MADTNSRSTQRNNLGAWAFAEPEDERYLTVFSPEGAVLLQVDYTGVPKCWRETSIRAIMSKWEYDEGCRFCWSATRGKKV